MHIAVFVCSALAFPLGLAAQQTNINKSIYINGGPDDAPSDAGNSGNSAGARGDAGGGGIRLNNGVTTKPGVGDGNGPTLSVQEQPTAIIPEQGGPVTNEIIIGERNNQQVIIFSSDAESSGINLGSDSLSNATDSRLIAVDNLDNGTVLENEEDQLFLSKNPKVTVRADDVVIFNKNGEAACVRIGSVGNEGC